MSETLTAPTTPEADRGKTEADQRIARQRELFLKAFGFGLEHERSSETTSADDFRYELESLEKALLNNPHVNFTEEHRAGWVVDDGGEDEGSIYGKILSRFQGDDDALLPHEKQIFDYMRAETQLNHAQTKVRPEAMEDAFGKMTDILTELESKHTLLTDPEAILENKRNINTLKIVIADMERQGQNDDDDDYTPVELYAKHIEAGGDPNDPDMQQAISMQLRYVRVYDMLAEKYPAEAYMNSEQLAEHESSEKLQSLRGRQANASQRLAEQTAIRQKRLALLDPANYGKKKATYEALNVERMSANQELIAEEIRNMTFTSQDEINLYIATRTVDLCKGFDEEVRQNYMKNDKLVGKAINFLTGRNADGTPDKSKSKTVARILVQAGVVAGAVAATVATGGIGAAVFTGSAAGLRVYAQGQKIVRDKRVKRTGGLLSKEEVLARIQASDNLSQASGEFLAKNNDVRIAAAAGLERKKLDKDTRNWRLGNVATVMAGIVAGTAAGTIAYGINSGSETASAFDGSSASEAPSAATTEVSSPVLETYIGPSDVYVSPGDGFFNVFQDMGIPESQWNDVLSKVGPELVQSGDAYWMPDGTPGISNPGMLSQHAFEAIMKAKGF